MLSRLLVCSGVAAALTLVLVACAPSFKGISHGTPDTMVSISTGGGAADPSEAGAPPSGTACLQVWIDNAGTNAAGIREALGATCEVIQSSSFEQALFSQPSWSNGTQLGGEVSATGVRTDVMALQPTPIHVLVAPVSRSNASVVAVDEETGEPARKAGTNDRPAIKIDPERVALWQSSDKRLKACLVDAFAHELTHLVPEGSGSVDSKYQDISHESREHKAPYAFGHAVGCTYLGLPIGCAEMKDCPGT